MMQPSPLRPEEAAVKAALAYVETEPKLTPELLQRILAWMKTDLKIERERRSRK
ncbi:MAG: hypothetical protein GY943_09095 [Chloroflexi bacterium]|nr:hypothetical protein [Chloroflexota bacterium]